MPTLGSIFKWQSQMVSITVGFGIIFFLPLPSKLPNMVWFLKKCNYKNENSNFPEYTYVTNLNRYYKHVIENWGTKRYKVKSKHPLIPICQSPFPVSFRTTHFLFLSKDPKNLIPHFKDSVISKTLSKTLVTENFSECI